MLRFAAVASQLSELLRVRYVPGSHAQAGAVGQALGDVLRFHNSARYLDRDIELARLSLLAQQLTEIGQHDQALLAGFRRRLRANPLSDYYGARQEVAVARRLLFEGINFDHELPQKADFVIRGDGGQEAGIECTSAHLTTANDRDMAYKLRAKLRDKAKKDYADRTVAIAFDTTSIDAVGGVLPHAAAEAALAETSFGALFLFTVMLNKDHTPPRFEQNYRRLDADAIAPELSKLLDRAYPKGAYHVTDYAVARAP